jgi:hypothetical protein
MAEDYKVVFNKMFDFLESLETGQRKAADYQWVLKGLAKVVDEMEDLYFRMLDHPDTDSECEKAVLNMLKANRELKGLINSWIEVAPST